MENMFKQIKQDIENKFLNVLQRSAEFTNKRVFSSPRAVGDIVQEIAAEELAECIEKGILKDFSGDFARRAMADVAFTDKYDNFYIVDIKTHNIGTDFNMPNLTSVERLARFYEEDKNNFAVLVIEYSTANEKLVFNRVKFILIEHLSWQCLTIGALGWGQIQIANSNRIVEEMVARKQWMLTLCDKLDIFYPKEIGKIKDRIDKFWKVRKFWEDK